MNAYLLLANGMVFAGQSVGAEGVTVGEVVFATGMVGFQETLTDPSYYGQIITQTYPLIGNYGMNHDDMESDKIWASRASVSALLAGSAGSNVVRMAPFITPLSRMMRVRWRVSMPSMPMVSFFFKKLSSVSSQRQLEGVVQASRTM